MAGWDRKAYRDTAFGRMGRLVTVGADLNESVVKGVVMSAAGDITVIPVDGSDGDALAFSGVESGFMPPFKVKKVTAATVSVYTVEY